MCIKCTDVNLNMDSSVNPYSVPVWALQECHKLEMDTFAVEDYKSIIKRTWYRDSSVANGDVYICITEYKYFDGYQDQTDEIEFRISR